ncbi:MULTISPECIES: WhiB family transcriptional regulator [unclassified Streptomyces]|uniref:WhiB family transcriptional regulator n=1 Tax=unclassified Streptomyces TaxID=2593676 RepID=UPI00109E9CFC|nr:MULTISPECIES: WhiB family transcriptional regulator [unclassified Streptomyces]MBT2453321.1 WhiB family transcriptional regulator [Streptomyces sp. ISL-86]THA44133.1 WhiB family transcriptional regulator [Streptomyces sp. A1136]
MPRIPRPNDHLTLPRAHHWSDDAACAGVETATFFPVGKGGVPASVDASYAKEFCVRCPVRSECLGHALTFREDYGVWGGLDEDERAELLRQARRSAEKQRRLEREKEKADATSAA